MIILLQILHIAFLSLRQITVFPEFYIFPYLVSHGYVPYSQVIDQHFPGVLLLPINLYSLGFHSFEDLKKLFIVVILIQSIYVSILAKKIWNTQKYQSIAVGLFAIFQLFIGGNALWIDTLIPLATLPALVSILNSQFFLSGVFFGISIILKQTMLVVTGMLAIMIFIQHKTKNAIKFLAGVTCLPLIMIMYFATRGVLKDFIYWTINFNINVYPILAHLRPQTDVLRIVVLSCICIGVFIFQKISIWRKTLISIIIIGSSIGGAARFDIYHLHASVPYLAIIGTYFISQKSKMGICLLAIFIPCLLYFNNRQTPYNYLDTNTISLIEFIKSQTKPSEKIFLLGVQPHVYALSNTLPSGNIFFFQLPWYFQSLENRQLQELMTSRPDIIIFDQSSEIDYIPIQKSAMKLVQFIDTQYNQYHRINNFIVYKHK